MKISERYSIARNASSLKSEARTCLSASDVLGAAGMAALQKAFSDFHNKTGVGVCGVDIAPHCNLAGQTLYTTVTIELESL